MILMCSHVFFTHSSHLENSFEFIVILNLKDFFISSRSHVYVILGKLNYFPVTRSLSTHCLVVKTWLVSLFINIQKIVNLSLKRSGLFLNNFT